MTWVPVGAGGTCNACHAQLHAPQVASTAAELHRPCLVPQDAARSSAGTFPVLAAARAHAGGWWSRLGVPGAHDKAKQGPLAGARDWLAHVWRPEAARGERRSCRLLCQGAAVLLVLPLNPVAGSPAHVVNCTPHLMTGD